MSADTEGRLLSVLSERRGMKMRAGEIEAALKRSSNCPDDIIRSLNTLKRKGLVHYDIDSDGATHVWWVE